MQRDTAMIRHPLECELPKHCMLRPENASASAEELFDHIDDAQPRVGVCIGGKVFHVEADLAAAITDLQVSLLGLRRSVAIQHAQHESVMGELAEVLAKPGEPHPFAQCMVEIWQRDHAAARAAAYGEG